MDYSSDYTYYDPTKTHREQMDNEKKKKTDFEYPSLFVGTKILNVPDFELIPVCIPAFLGIPENPYRSKFMLTKGEIKKYAKKFPNQFWNVNYVSSTNAIRICKYDINDRFSFPVYTLINGVLKEQINKGAIIKDVNFDSYEEEFVIDDIQDIGCNIFLTTTVTFIYNKVPIKLDVCVNLQGYLMLYLYADWNSGQGRHFNIFTNSFTDTSADINDSCRSFSIAKKIFIEWLDYLLYAIKEMKEIKPELTSQLINSSDISNKDSDSKIIDISDRFTKTEQEEEKYKLLADKEAYITRHKATKELAAFADNFLLEHMLKDSVVGFDYKIEVAYTGRKSRKGELVDIDKKVVGINIIINQSKGLRVKSVKARLLFNISSFEYAIKWSYENKEDMHFNSPHKALNAIVQRIIEE